jgi:hypothetical protein
MTASPVKKIKYQNLDTAQSTTTYLTTNSLKSLTTMLRNSLLKKVIWRLYKNQASTLDLLITSQQSLQETLYLATRQK